MTDDWPCWHETVCSRGLNFLTNLSTWEQVRSSSSPSHLTIPISQRRLLQQLPPNLVSSTSKYFEHVDQATSISQLEEGIAGFQLAAETHNSKRIHRLSINKSNSRLTKPEMPTHVNVWASIVKLLTTSNTPLVNNSSLYNETVTQNTSRQPPKGHDPVVPGVIPRRHPFPWMLALIHRVGESNVT